jgi:hypothetical protein
MIGPQRRARQYGYEAMQRRMQSQRKKKSPPVGDTASSENDTSKFGTWRPGISSFSGSTRRSY